MLVHIYTRRYQSDSNHQWWRDEIKLLILTELLNHCSVLKQMIWLFYLWLITHIMIWFATSYTYSQATQPGFIRHRLVSQQHWPTDNPAWSKAICRHSLQPPWWTWWLSFLQPQRCSPYTVNGQQSLYTPLQWAHSPIFSFSSGTDLPVPGTLTSSTYLVLPYGPPRDLSAL